MRRFTLALLACAAALLATASQAQGGANSDWAHPCGPLRTPTSYGPFDYRVDRDKLEIVEWGHFRPATEQLIKPRFSSFGADLAYTLKAFPNHHRALNTLIRLYDREPGVMPNEGEYSYSCWFERAMRFRPDDLIVRMLWASFLSKTKRDPQAVLELDYVAAVAGDDGFTHYNAGLLYAKVGEHAKALREAHRAMALGFERTDLRDLLVKGGHWTDPPPATRGAGASGPATSATAPAAATPSPAVAAPVPAAAPASH